jgi:hypothetical protein
MTRRQLTLSRLAGFAGEAFEPIEQCSVSSAACTKGRKVLASSGTVTKCAERK